MQTVIVQDFIICKRRRIVIRVAFLYKAVYVMRFTHKNDVVRGFVCRAEQYTPEIFLFLTATFKYKYRAPLRRKVF
jgi:hypothetical protein